MENVPIEFLIVTLLMVALASSTFLLNIIYCLSKTIIGIEGRLPFSSGLHVCPDSVKAWYKIQSATPAIFIALQYLLSAESKLKSFAILGKKRQKLIFLMSKRYA